MMPPKAHKEATAKKSEKMITLEAEKPFCFPTSDMPQEEKEAWDAWVIRWNAACKEAGCGELACIMSGQAII